MFKHLGATATKFTYRVLVKAIVLLDMQDELDYGDTLCVSLERKAQSVYTSEKPVTLDSNDEIVCEVGEELQTTASLYKDKATGGWKPKTATLSVLQRKKGPAGLSANSKEAFRTIGLVSLPLHVLADNGPGPGHEMDLLLGWCKSERAYMEVVVTSSAVVDSDAVSVDDDSSVTAAPPSSSSSASASAPSAAAASRKPRLAPLREEAGEDELRNKIFELENALLASADIVDYERGRAKEALLRAARAEDDAAGQRGAGAASSSKLAEHYEAEVQRLTEEVRRLSAANEASLSKLARAEGAMSNQSKAELERARAEAAGLSQALAATSEENKAMKALMSKASDEIDRLSDRVAALEAALRGKEDEAEVLLQQLIAAKLAVGEVSTELEEAKQQVKKLRSAGNPNGQQPRPRPSTGGGAGAQGHGPGGQQQYQQQQQQQYQQQQYQQSSYSSTPSSAGTRPANGHPFPPSSPSDMSVGSASSGNSAMLVGFGGQGQAKRSGAGPNNPFNDLSSNMRRGFGAVSSNIQHLSNMLPPASSEGMSLGLGSSSNRQQQQQQQQQSMRPARPNF